jgi:hypothetical protein
MTVFLSLDLVKQGEGQFDIKLVYIGALAEENYQHNVVQQVVHPLGEYKIHLLWLS